MSRFMIELIFLILFFNRVIIAHVVRNEPNENCDENTVNLHLLQCYKELIDPTIDSTSSENAFYIDENLLCQAFNQSINYRRCLFSIFDENQICRKTFYPYSYEYLKIYWKLILSSCSVNQNLEQCQPSNISQDTLMKCHYSFDDKSPRKCREFLTSVKCMENHEGQLISANQNSQSKCAINKAYYHYYGDLAARLQLAIHYCEQDSSLLNDH